MQKTPFWQGLIDCKTQNSTDVGFITLWCQNLGVFIGGSFGRGTKLSKNILSPKIVSSKKKQVVMLRMNKFHVWVLSLAGLLAGTTCKGADGAKIDTSTVRQLDVERFMGQWYEIARYEHRFERGMTHVTAEYTLLPDGTIRVVNRGLKDGKPKEIVGKARRPNPVEYPGRLEV